MSDEKDQQQNNEETQEQKNKETEEQRNQPDNQSDSADSGKQESSEGDNKDQKSEEVIEDIHIIAEPENQEPKNIPGVGLVKPRGIVSEMQESYLDYAMSVIVARALPDVRDGLKPVHRRVLYSMHELGLRSNVKYRKSATVVGDVLGKYHPHGDVAVYDSLVRMAQPFSMRYRLVDGQGNFGSMDGDNAAAMRYTECRMTKISEEMLADIEKNTVDFSPNYDGSREEPQVLPAKVPQLLLNGTLGIAVGMATNIPPHNLGEIIDGVIYLIDNPESTIENLMQFVKGPDFPTGAHIYNIEGIRQAYTTGKGPVLMRAVANIEETPRRGSLGSTRDKSGQEKGGGHRIIISQLPYQVNKAELVSKIATLVKLKKLEGISDLRDESDRKEGVRIVIELKHHAYPKKILNLLYELTPMQSVFHVNMLALIDGIQPRVLTLKDVLQEFIKHRQTVVRRRTRYELDVAKARAHILEGLKIALDNIDEVIETIKKSQTKEVAHKNLISRFKLSVHQATAILEMRLSALAGLERKKVEDELREKLELIKKLEAILASKQRILEIIKKELEELKEKYADPRRSKIFGQKVGSFSQEDLIPNEQVVVTLTRGNYIKRVPVSSYKSQHRGGKGIVGMTTKDEDAVEHLLVTQTHNDIMFFSDRGRVFNAKVFDLPAASRQAKGQAIVNVLQISPEEKVTAVITYDQKEKENHKYFFMGTKNGVVKRTEISQYQHVRKTGLIAIKLRPDDLLKWVITTSGDDKIIMITKKGQAIYFSESDVRPMGRSASGVRGIRLKEGNRVIAMDVIKDPECDLFTILERGFGKRCKVKNFTLQKRGGIGIRASKVNVKTGPVVEAMIVCEDEGEVVIISAHGQMIRLPLKSVKRLGRDTQGVTLMRLKQGDKVASMTVFRKEKEIGEERPERGEEKNVKIQMSPHKTDPLYAENVKKEDKSEVRNNQLEIGNKDKNKAKQFASSKLPPVAQRANREDKVVTINEIKPKKINTTPKDFKPKLKLVPKTKPQEFKPYIKSAKIQTQTQVFQPVVKSQAKKQELLSVPKQQVQIKHYQGSNTQINSSANPKNSQKNTGPNYWGGKPYNSRKK